MRFAIIRAKNSITVRLRKNSGNSEDIIEASMGQLNEALTGIDPAILKLVWPEKTLTWEVLTGTADEVIPSSYFRSFTILTPRANQPLTAEVQKLMQLYSEPDYAQIQASATRHGPDLAASEFACLREFSKKKQVILKTIVGVDMVKAPDPTFSPKNGVVMGVQHNNDAFALSKTEETERALNPAVTWNVSHPDGYWKIDFNLNAEHKVTLHIDP